MRLIDFDALGVGKCNPEVFDDKGYANGWNNAIEILQNATTVDAVPVVRCKDCKWYLTDGGLGYCGWRHMDGDLSENFYCADGERKGGDEDDLQSVGSS